MIALRLGALSLAAFAFVQALRAAGRVDPWATVLWLGFAVAALSAAVRGRR